jgi:CMP-N-acetylneuraminic acid synthetase
MIKGKKVILTICARGGSKGIPKKNIRPILGKPLLAYTIEQAQSLDWVDRLIVSTDNSEIKKIAEQWRVEIPFLRPPGLARDNSPKVLVIIHAVKEAEKYWHEQYDLVIDLDPTSPLRNQKDIELATNLMFSKPKPSAVITAAVARRNPYFNIVEINEKGYVYLSKNSGKLFSGRQDAPKAYDMNGSIYVIWKDVLLKEKTFFTEKTKLFLMPPERSFDIDTKTDFKIVEMLIRERKGSDN